MYKSVFVKKGKGGWGKGLALKPEGKKTKVVSITGGGVHPVASRIAELTGTEAIDGFNNAVDEAEIMAVVIDCGGTARIGVYPMKGILTIDILPSSPSGPLSEHITEENFVSGVKPDDVELISDGVFASAKSTVAPTESKESFDEKYKKAKAEHQTKNKSNFVVSFSRGIGKVMGIFYQSGRTAIDMLIKNIIPFMAFISVIIGIISYTGIGDWIAHRIEPFAGSVWGMILVSIICSIPIISPLLGPGAVIAQVVGVFIGTQIGLGAIPVSYALPALFAINAQVGCDFIPVGLSLGEAKPETIEIGVPAILYSRIITGALSVLIAWVFSIGMY